MPGRENTASLRNLGIAGWHLQGILAATQGTETLPSEPPKPCSLKWQQVTRVTSACVHPGLQGPAEKTHKPGTETEKLHPRPKKSNLFTFNFTQ